MTSSVLFGHVKPLSTEIHRNTQKKEEILGSQQNHANYIDCHYVEKKEDKKRGMLKDKGLLAELVLDLCNIFYSIAGLFTTKWQSRVVNLFAPTSFLHVRTTQKRIGGLPYI
ncbi:hypothetical protein ACJX0J_009913 [Zea mays]